MTKILNVIKTVLSRFKSPVVWAGIGSMFVIIISAAGYKIEDLTTWQTLLDVLKVIINSPATIIAILVSIFGYINDSSNRTNF